MTHIEYPAKPSRPTEVSYALTVPQSVLFADLSLRGSTAPAFRRVWDIDYEPSFIEIDNGAMSWDLRAEDGFLDALADGLNVWVAIDRFMEGTGRTGRALDRLSAVLGASTPPSAPEQLLSLLREYWDAYELHMTNLFTYWNVESAVSSALIETLRSAGAEDDIRNGLVRFTSPSEPNYFVLERQHRERIARVFSASSGPVAGRPLAEMDKEVARAVAEHASYFGFLLAPFNLGAPPDAASVWDGIAALWESPSGAGAVPEMQADERLSDLDPRLRHLARVSHQFTFWKSERLDMFALADSRMTAYYRQAAAILNCELATVFALQRQEFEDALENRKLALSEPVLSERAANYCLILHDGTIAFYEPAEAAAPTSGAAAHTGDTLQGTPASTGTVDGQVRIVMDLADLQRVGAGDVLVTPMTRPEYGVALDHAAAFVTDEGGRNCHAAIIAREMGKPCVIATQTGTSTLRDGMLVRVDGAAGTVEVLEVEVHGA